MILFFGVSRLSRYVSAAICLSRLCLTDGTVCPVCQIQTGQTDWPFSLSRLSRHVLGRPPGTTAVNVTWMKTGFNAYQKHRSMYPSIFKCFPVIQPIGSKVRHFRTFFAHFGLPIGLESTRHESTRVKKVKCNVKIKKREEHYIK